MFDAVYEMDHTRKKLVVSLFEIDCFLFGNIKLSSEIYVSAYLDLAAIFSYPKLLNHMCNVACEYLGKQNISPSSICGVSYSGIPFAVLISSKLGIPLYLGSKEVNLNAEDQRILGNIVLDNKVTIIEEVISSGTSTLRVIKDIEDAGMKVENVFVMIDLEQGGVENLQKLGYQPISLFKLSEMRDSLFEGGYLTENLVGDMCRGFENQHVVSGDCITNTLLAKRMSMKYESRLELMKLPVAKKLFRIMLEKRSNVCVDLNPNSFEEVIAAANLIGPYVCIVGIHLDAYDNLTEDHITNLKQLASTHNFLLMDDRKLSESGCILLHQLRKILNIVDFVTVMPLLEINVLREMNTIADEMPDKGIFFTGSLFTQDSFLKASFEKDVVSIGLTQNRSLIGFVTHHNSSIPINYIHMMSDMRSTGSSTGRSHNSFYSLDLISEMLAADVVISFFSNTSDILNSLIKLRHASWQSYENRCRPYVKEST